MLTPRFLQRITEATEDKTAKLNKYLTQRIIDRILHVYEKTGEVNINTAALFDALKQQESGRLFDEVVDEIAKRLPEIQNEVRQAFYDSAGKISNDMYLFAQEIVELEDIPNVKLPKVSDFERIGIPKKAKNLNLTPKEIRLLEAAYKRTNGEIYNITRTTAQASEKTFINACDSAWWKVTHGVSRDEAIMEAIDEVAEKGITTVHYANREEKIEVAIARAVRTGVNQANGDITLTRCAEMGVGYVLVNEHLGARVTKYEDYTNHAYWQGKVYKLNWNNPVLAQYQPTPQEINENSKSHSFLAKIKEFLTGASRIKDEKYKDFIEVCGYGKMLGICGINCRHSFNQFYPGINNNTNKGIDSQENAQRYANEQKQRAMERNMRDMKRREEALAYAEKQTDNEEITKRRKELQEKLKKKREEYVDFCAENKLTRESHRLQIAKVFGVENHEIVPRSMSNDFVKRTHEDIYKAARNIKSELDGIMVKKSKWSEKIIFHEGVGCKKEWNCDITLCEGASNIAIRHELLHSYSLSHYPKKIYLENQILEETNVELLSREIERIKTGYWKPLDEKYDSDLMKLLRINEIAKLYPSRYEYTLALINQDLPKRMQWLTQKVYNNLDNIDEELIDELYSCITRVSGRYDDM